MCITKKQQLGWHRQETELQEKGLGMLERKYDVTIKVVGRVEEQGKIQRTC